MRGSRRDPITVLRDGLDRRPSSDFIPHPEWPPIVTIQLPIGNRYYLYKTELDYEGKVVW